MVKNAFASLDVINQKRNPNNITQILHFLASSFTYGYVGRGLGGGCWARWRIDERTRPCYHLGLCSNPVKKIKSRQNQFIKDVEVV